MLHTFTWDGTLMIEIRTGFAQTHHLMFDTSVDEGESTYPESVVSVLILQQQHQQDQRQPV